MKTTSGWELRPLKQATELSDEVLSETTSPDYAFRYVDIGNVDSTGRVLGFEDQIFASAPSRARRVVRRRDIILSTVRTYLRAIAFIEEPANDLVASTGFAVLRAREGVLPRFLWRALQASSFLDEVVARSEGVSYPAISPSKLGAIKVPIPRLVEQGAIVRFLDEETARIDALIEKKNRLVEGLQEDRTARVDEAVVGSLDSSDALPTGWTLRRNKNLFREVNEKPNREMELLTVSHLTGVTTRAEKQVYMFMAESFDDYKVCREGDLVINTMWAWMGAAGVSPLDGIVSPSYGVYRILQAAPLLPQFLDYLIRSKSYVGLMDAHSEGVWRSRLRLYPEVFLRMRIPLPPLPLQRQIVERLNAELANNRILEGKLKESVTTLLEYRSALITAAVTGELHRSGRGM